MRMKKYITLLMLLISTELSAQNFQKINTGIVVNDAGDSRSVNWADVNNDGLLDLFISNGLNTGERNFLYINKGNFVFEKVDSNAVIVRDKAPYDGASWADIDNDGDLDMMVVTWYGQKNVVYLNEGNLQFKKITSGAIATDLTYSESIAWADYDKDGKLDAYVSNSFGNKKNLLYRGNGDSTFVKITTGPAVVDANSSRSIHWVDVDADHDLDLFVCNENNENENLYLNNNDGTFSRSLSSNIVKQGRSTITASWGDYDNDGDLDVFLGNDGSANQLFRNDGALNFVEQIFPSDSIEYTFGSAWADVDNDADLDLFITQAFSPNKSVNKLYLNTNGIFTLDTLNSFSLDSGWSYGCAFGDVDRDGFLDLAVANCYEKKQNNSLYKNTGNSNNWIVLTCKDLSGNNRSAIGSIARIKTNVNGQELWQMREITSVSGHNGQNMMDLHFGIGNASTIDSLIIEWPSGSIETYTNINSNQYLVVNKGLGLNTKNDDRNIPFNIIPNPVIDKIYIESIKSLENEYYEIFDMQGKKIMSGMFMLGSIDIQHLKTGMYLLKIRNTASKFIKQ